MDFPKLVAAFDLEIANDLVDEGGVRTQADLGITEIGIAYSDDRLPAVYYGTKPDYSPAPRMAWREVRQFLKHLWELHGQGATIVSWNGLAFDWPILAEESGLLDTCKGLALAHVDPGYEMVTRYGFMPGLAKAGAVIGMGKTEGVSGDMAPQMWRDGRFDEAMEYVKQDAVLTLAVFQAACENNKYLRWISRAGNLTSRKLTLCSVADVLALGLPPVKGSGGFEPWNPRDFDWWFRRDKEGFRQRCEAREQV